MSCSIYILRYSSVSGSTIRRTNALLLFWLFVFMPMTLRASFETQLSAVYAAVNKGACTKTLDLLNNLGPSALLEDLRLSLKADALRAAGRKEEAFRIYKQLVESGQEWLPAKQAAFQYVILGAEILGTPALDKLSSVARGLATPYQRGRALEALINLYPPASRERSLAALEALRAYRSNSAFFDKMPESGKLLDSIVSSPVGWAFTSNEWIEIIRTAIKEKPATRIEFLFPAIHQALGPSSEVIMNILLAEAAALSNNRERAFTILNDVFATPGIDAATLALAHQIRGDILSAVSRHTEAVPELQQALSWGKPPVDVLAARYRLMRSAFFSEQDQIALAEAAKLCNDEMAKKLSILPVHLYEMGLERYDRGLSHMAMPWFQLVANYFPAHHRADDALGYAAICAGITTQDGAALIKRLESLYPHSFYVYWLNPPSRNKPLPYADSKLQPAADQWKKRSAAWALLLKSPFSGIAREEIRTLLAAHPQDFALFKLTAETAESAGQYNLAVAIGEIMVRVMLESGRSTAELPLWAWRIHYPRPWWPIIQRESNKFGIDPYWTLAIMREESHFDPKIRSRSDARGLMQILPSTGKWIATKIGIKGKFNSESLWNIERNISFGAWYLSYLRNLFGGDLFLAAAAYNGGQGNITRKVEEGPYANLPVLERLDRVPLPETRDYYKKVMGSWWNYRRLYK